MNYKTKTLVAFVFTTALFLISGLPVYAMESINYNYDDWQVTCVKADEKTKKDFCIMNHRGIDSQSGRAIYQLGLRLNDDQSMMFEALVPLGVTLKAEFELKIDEKKIFKLPYSNCISQGCLVQINLNKKQEASFRNGQKGTLIFYDAKNNKITLPVSLNGFTKSAKKLRSK